MKGKHGHKKEHRRADGGRADMKVSGNPDVFKEADERKHGGKVKKKELGHAEGKMAKHRRDRARGGKACRAKGGRVGADKSPLSSAHHGGSAGERAGGQPD
jgi:hypothetical protein